MTVLGKRDIEYCIDKGEIRVESEIDLPPSIEPASMDVHLSRDLKYPFKEDNSPVVVDDESTYPMYSKVSSDRPYISAGKFALATTQETIEVPRGKVALLHGRSSVGRLGLFIENAGLIDPGFTGQVTLELMNPEEYGIELKAGMRIGQLTFHDVKTAPDVGYSEHNGNKYQGQTGPTPSKLFEDFQ